MDVVQPIIAMPAAIQAGIDIGIYFREGSVIRNVATGRIVKLLKEVPDTSEMAEKAVAATARMTWIPSKPVVIVGSAVALAAVIGVGFTLHAVKKQAERIAAMPECMVDFGTSWDRYRDAIVERRLNVNVIDQFIADFDELLEYSIEHDKGTLDWNTEQGRSLGEFVADYTGRLAEANSVDLDDLRNQAQAEEPLDLRETRGDVVVELRRNLAVQRKIFGDAA